MIRASPLVPCPSQKIYLLPPTTPHIRISAANELSFQLSNPLPLLILLILAISPPLKRFVNVNFFPPYVRLLYIDIICTFSTTQSGLVSLGLADNLIGDEGAGALAELVRQSDTLETIILSGNDIGNEGGSIMIAALAQNTSLKALYMAGVSYVYYNNFLCMNIFRKTMKIKLPNVSE